MVSMFKAPRRSRAFFSQLGALVLQPQLGLQVGGSRDLSGRGTAVP